MTPIKVGRSSDVRAPRSRWVRFCLGLAWLCGLPGATTWAQEKPIAFVGARLETADGAAIEAGVLVVRGGRIEAIGGASTAIPAGAELIRCEGKTILPGLVDTHSHIGGVGGADGSGPIQPEVRVLDSINVLDPGFRRAVAGGLTTLNIMPGSGHLLSGQTVYVKLRKARTIEEMLVDGPGKPAAGGIKMANGTNSMREAPFPGTRGKSAALVRERYAAAQQYREKLAAAGADVLKAPSRDLGLEALNEVLDRKRVVHHHTHRADDIITVLRLQREFGFRVVLHHVSEAWKVADEIAQAGVPVSAIVVDSPGGKLEAAELRFETCGILEKAGVLVAIHTDDWITDSRLFLRSAALAIRGGMTRGGAIQALTINGAKMLDLDQRIGSLAVGKDADFVILSGDPFSTYTKVEQTWVEGVKVFDRADPADLLYAVGGRGAGNEQTPYLCCTDQGFQFGGKQWGASGD